MTTPPLGDGRCATVLRPACQRLWVSMAVRTTDHDHQFAVECAVPGPTNTTSARKLPIMN
jgi:hypothetical protein